MEKINVVLYARTSTKKQDINSQMKSMFNECEKNNWNILKYFKDDGISGLNNQRDGLLEMIEYIKINKVDKIITYELSRISRDIDFFKSFIIDMCNMKVSIFFIDKQFETLRNDYSMNTNVISIINDEIKYANAEINKIKNRLNRGLEIYKKNGGNLGRKKGSKTTIPELLYKHEDIIYYIKKGYSLRLIPILTGKSISTCQRIKKILRENGETFTTKVTVNDVFKTVKNNDTEFLKDLVNKYELLIK